MEAQKLTNAGEKENRVDPNKHTISRNEKLILGGLSVIACLLSISFLILLTNYKKMKWTYEKENFPPDNNNIVVETWSGGMYIIQADGSIDTDHSLPSYIGNRPAWTLDGKWVASTFDGKLYIAQADGSNRTFVPSPGEVSQLTWSPNGRQLAFYYDKRYNVDEGTDASQGVYIVDRECLIRVKWCTTAFIDLYIPGEDNTLWPLDGAPTICTNCGLEWLSDRQMAYSSYNKGSHIFVSDVFEKKTPVNLTPAFSGTISWFDLSPDGTKLLGLCYHDESPHNYNVICVMDRDGSNLTDFKLPNGLVYFSNPKWSPSGREIAFIATVQNERANKGFCWDNCYSIETIFIMNADGSDLRRINLSGDDTQVNWFTWYPYK